MRKSFLIFFTLIVVSFFLNNEVKATTTCGQAVSYGGQSYNTVQIGDQCWFKENLNVGIMIGNTEVPDNTAPTINDSSTVSKWCYDSSSAYCDSEGGLYTWAEANAQPHSCNTTSCSVSTPNQGICPSGWHVPSDEEFYTLENYLKTPGETCDATRFTWDCLGAGTKLIIGGSSGFDAIGAGNHETTGETSFFDKREPSVHFWSSTPALVGEGYAYNRTMTHLYTPGETVHRSHGRGIHGASIRCLADSITSTPSIPTAEREALVALYNSTQGEQWSNIGGWLGEVGTECDWEGITCNTEKTHVIEISLNYRYLNGNLPEELGNLTYLKNLYLKHNTITGNFPLGFTGLSNLITLNVDENSLTGEIPIGLKDFFLRSWGSLTLNDNDLCTNDEELRYYIYSVEGHHITLPSCPPACTEDTWECGSWGACSSDSSQTRSCTKTFDCSSVNTPSPVTTQSCSYTAPTCISWTYSAWDACSSSGQQTRTISSYSPSGCTGGNPVLSQSCTYIPPTCTSWTYSDWSTCSTNGQQTRNIISSSPSDCNGGNPVLTQSCNYAPSCTTDDWSCDSWSSCSTNGIQNRTCNKTSNCEGGVSPPTTTQSCNYTPPCNSDTWECGSWDSCSSSGLQSRQCIITDDCQSVNTPSPNTTQSCDYVKPCSADIWECGSWSSCSPNGVQARSCSKTYDCSSVENAPPETSQTCTPPYNPNTDTSSQQLTNQDSIIKSTVKLLCGNEYEWLSQGSGTVIGSNGLILTNKHVIDGSIGCLVAFVNNASDIPNFTNSSPVAGILKISSYEDMAVLKIINYNVSEWIDVTKGNSSSLKLGNRINIYGYPNEDYYGETITFTSGDFSGYGTGALKNYLKTTASMDHGVSGGGTYLNDGTFVGMPTLGYSTGSSFINYILSINTIKSWLSSNSIYANSVYSKNDYAENYSVLTDYDISGIPLLSIAEANVLIYSNELKSKILPHSIDVAQDYNKPVFVINNLSDIDGYYVYFGDDITADVVNDGQFISGNEFSPEKITTNGTYYFIFKAKDKQGIMSDVKITPYVYGAVIVAEDNNTTSVDSVVAEEKELITKVDDSLSNRVSGNILLQVEKNGEGWYVYPDDKKKYYLGRPTDAFSIMRNLGLGVSEDSYDSFNGYAPARLSGKILLRVEANGEAYYINPTDLKMYYLGRPADAFSVMRNLGLGITNSDIRKIDVGD